MNKGTWLKRQEAYIIKEWQRRDAEAVFQGCTPLQLDVKKKVDKINKMYDSNPIKGKVIIFGTGGSMRRDNNFKSIWESTLE